jgi:Flp pilus assembly protein TadG
MMPTDKYPHAAGNLAKDERGSISIMAVGVLVICLLTLGLVLDFGFAFNMRNQLQRTADAAALAGATQLGNNAKVRSEANKFAALNMQAAAHGDVLATNDIKIGNWNKDTRVFTNGGAPVNAVRVTTRRTSLTGNAVPAFLGPLANVFRYDIVTQAVAVNAGTTGDPCLNNGFVAAGKVYSGSENSVAGGFCIHGELGVKVGSQNEFHPGTEVSMPDLSDLEEGSDNNDNPPDGLINSIVERELIPEDALNIGSVISDLENGTFPELPDYLDGTIEHVEDLPANPTPGTLYIVENVVDFGSDANVEGFGVIGLQEVKVGSNSTVKNAMLISHTTLDMGSNIFIGDSDFCNSHDGEVFMGSKELMKMGSNTDVVGAQIISAGLADFGSDLVNFKSVGVQAAGDLKVGSQLQLSGCPNQTDEHLLIKNGNIRPQLVN